MSDSMKSGSVVAALLAVNFTLGLLAGWKATKDMYQEEARKRGFAEYSTETGEWRWKGQADGQ